MSEKLKKLVREKEMTEFEATLQYIFVLSLHTESTRHTLSPKEFLNNLLEEGIIVVPMKSQESES